MARYATAMQRITISVDADLAAAFDDVVRVQGYQSRSEAVRDLVRQAVDARDLVAEEGSNCVASLSYVYDHHVRAMAARLTSIGHAHHDLIVSTTHVHLDHRNCLETTILKGATGAVRALADAIRAERGVRFGALNLIRVEPNDWHAGGEHSHDGHGHLSPRRG